jgi:hypothetical protein
MNKQGYALWCRDGFYAGDSAIFGATWTQNMNDVVVYETKHEAARCHVARCNGVEIVEFEVIT